MPAPAAALAAGDNGAAWYRQLAAAGGQLLVIDPAQSLVAVTVRRGGVLARLGHDHVVASRSISGFAAPAEGRADFSFRLDQMTVDEPALRSEAGLDTQPPADAVAATRTNMLTRVLEADKFPLVVLRVLQAKQQALKQAPQQGHQEAHQQAHQEAHQAAQQPMQLSITLHGVTRTLSVPTHLEQTAGGLAASGTLQLRQTDFGITPMSVMGGAMTVEDTLELRFRIVARAPR